METTVDHQAILLPVLALLFLGFIVWLVMMLSRFKFIAAEKIDPQSLATPEQVHKALPISALNPSNNFKNLFEVPVLFIAMCFYLFTSNDVDSLSLNLAWGFVGFRYLHSLIQCTYNNVHHRFGAYAISTIALWVMLFRAGLNAM